MLIPTTVYKREDALKDLDEFGVVRVGAVVAPGAHDAFSAKVIERCGFEAVQISGYGVAGSLLCRPDVGLVQMKDVLDMTWNGVAVATGDRLSPNSIVLAMAGAFLLYSFFGGLISTAYSDFIQGLMIIILSMMLIPSGLAAVGGMAGMRAALPPDFFRLYSEVSGLDAFTIAMLAVNGIVGITAQPHMISMCATGNTERAGRIGQTYGSLVKRLCTIGWAFTGLIVAALVVQRGVVLTDGEMAFGYACKTLLVPGLTGLMM